MDRRVLALPQLVDQRQARFEHHLARFELVDLAEDFLEARFFALRRRDVFFELRGLLAERPIPPAEGRQRQHEDQAAEDHHLLAGFHAA